RPLSDAENFGGGVSFLTSLHIIRSPRRRGVGRNSQSNQARAVAAQKRRGVGSQPKAWHPRIRWAAACPAAARPPQAAPGPRGRAAEQRDELATAAHSITSSASASKRSGMVRPSVLAVFRLITNSNLVDCSTGRSAGFAPLRIFAV